MKYPIQIICTKNVLLDLYSWKLYKQQRMHFDPRILFNYFLHNERTTSASIEVVVYVLQIKLYWTPAWKKKEELLYILRPFSTEKMANYLQILTMNLLL